MQIVAYENTEELSIQTPAYRSLVRPYIGTVAAMHDGPQAFLVDMLDDGDTISPHFHDVDQFQVFVRGRGRFGQQPVEPVAFHYADAYTPYGPIVANAEGIAFLTVRAACASANFPMPASRHLMPGKPGRNITGRFEIGGNLPETAVLRRQLVSEPDGLKVVSWRARAGALMVGEPAEAGDQYYLVCSGRFLIRNNVVSTNALIHVAPAEPPLELQAISNVAEALLLQMPRPSERPGSDPGQLALRRKQAYAMPAGTTIGN